MIFIKEPHNDSRFWCRICRNTFEADTDVREDDGFRCPKCGAQDKTLDEMNETERYETARRILKLVHHHVPRCSDYLVFVMGDRNSQILSTADTVGGNKALLSAAFESLAVFQEATNKDDIETIADDDEIDWGELDD